jgi:CBS domain-containing protein
MSSVLQHWSVTSTASLEDVIQLLCSQKATACAVIHGVTNELIGIVTESDVVVACQDCASAGRMPSDTTVVSILLNRKLERGVLETALPSSEIYMKFAIQMGMAKSKHLPIVTSDNKFAGIMTASAAVKQILLNDRSSADVNILWVMKCWWCSSHTCYCAVVGGCNAFARLVQHRRGMH